MSGINIDSRIYTLHGLTPILGSLPALKDVRTDYVTSKAKTKEAFEEESSDYEVNDRNLTVFARNKQGKLCIMGYQVKGFFKAALSALRGTYAISSYKSKVDLLLFVDPRFIQIKRENGDSIDYEDTILERPLRAHGPTGERVTLMASEQVNDPWEVEMEISLLPSLKTNKSEALTWDVVEAALDYGAYHGLGQWRNADYGRFTWTRKE